MDGNLGPKLKNFKELGDNDPIGGAQQHLSEQDALIFNEFFPNETNRIWCPTEKGEVGLCSPRCPVSSLFVGLNFQTQQPICLQHMTFYYKNGEVTVTMDESCGGLKGNPEPEYMDLD